MENIGNIEDFIQRWGGVTESYWFYNHTIELRYSPDDHVYLLVTPDGLETQKGCTNICHIIDKSIVLIPWVCKMMAQKIYNGISNYARTDSNDITIPGEEIKRIGEVGGGRSNWAHCTQLDRWKTYFANILLGALLCLFGCMIPALPIFAQIPAGGEPDSSGYGLAKWPQALRMADYILSLQNSSGAITDERGSNSVNQDSNMEYALMGLGAAYSESKNVKYLNGLEKGIRWLAAREEMTDRRWKGSWYYVYSAGALYGHIPTSPGSGIQDVRGVDATSALFVYLVYLDQRLTGNNGFAQVFSSNCRAALEFIIRQNLDSDGFSRSSWQLYASDGQWHLFNTKYSADQGDVYLGMRAGEILYHDARYGRVALALRYKTPERTFSSSLKRYALAMQDDGKLDTNDDGNSAAFSQGYLSWIWGNTNSNRAALQWLQSKVQPDGSIITVEGKPAFSLNAAMLAMASRALSQPAPGKSLQWLVDKGFDPDTGGVRNSLATDGNHEFNNETAFCLLGFLGFSPFE